MREVLVAHLLDDVGRGQEHRHGDVIPGSGEDQLVEVGQGNDQVDGVLGDESRELWDVARVVDASDELVPIRVVERGSERVDVDRERRRAGPAEGRDDVDALARACEEDGGHGERA